MHGALQCFHVPAGARPQGGVVVVTSGPFLWHVGCTSWVELGVFSLLGALYCSVCHQSENRDLKEGKALSWPWVNPKVQPKGPGCCRLWCDGVNMDYGTDYRSGVGVGDGAATVSHGPSRNLHFETCPDLDVPTVPLAALELFQISHESLELW